MKTTVIRTAFSAALLEAVKASNMEHTRFGRRVNGNAADGIGVKYVKVKPASNRTIKKSNSTAVSA